MTNFSINQVRHFYVVNNLADCIINRNNDIEDSVTIQFRNAKGEFVPSDIIDLNNIIRVTNLNHKCVLPLMRVATITADSIIKGNEYTVKVTIKNAVGDNNAIVKYGSVLAASSTVNADFYNALATSLTKVADGMFGVVAGDSKLQIGPYVNFEGNEAGAVPFKPYDIDVTLLSEEEWAWNPVEWEYKKLSGDKPNGSVIADMEWFYIGARGDMYRNFGHPYSPKTKTLADPNINYDIIDIHYAYVGPNEGAQKSEKTITIAVSTKVDLTSFFQTLSDMGISMQSIDNYMIYGEQVPT